MHTLRLFAAGQLQIPLTTAWYASDLGEFRGKQELYTRQSPQRLKVLREHALIESAVSSNRIEGVAVEPSRIREVLVAPKPLFRDRDEEEVRGYRDALSWIHGSASEIPVTEETIGHLHATARGQIWDAGKYKEKDGDIIERYADGTERVRFRTVMAADTPRSMSELIREWDQAIEDRWAPSLILLAAFNLDFLCIHPFRDGNGRVSRLLGYCKAIVWATKSDVTSVWSGWWSRTRTVTTKPWSKARKAGTRASTIRGRTLTMCSRF